MKIAVLVKQVPETGTVVRSEDSSIVNPLDLHALEAALRIKDAEPATWVVALSMGPSQAESALREALAMGCDEAVLVTGKEFGGSDTWTTSRTLSAALGKLGPFGLVFCGEKATDGDTGQVGPEVAAFLGLPVITYVGSLSLSTSPSGPGVRVERIVEDGIQVVASGTPLIMSFCKAIGKPRLPLLSVKRMAKESKVRRLGLVDLGLSAEETGAKGSPTRVVKIDRPRLTRKASRKHATP